MLDDGPEAGEVGKVRRTLVHHAGRAVAHRPVDDVTVPGDPADVGGAPVDVVVAQVEDVFGSDARLDEVAGGRVDDALGFAGRAGGVEDEEQVLAVHRLGGTVGGLPGDRVRPPDVTA